MKILLIILLTINSATAIDITPIKKGEPAPANGFFVDKKNIKKFREINENKKLLEQENGKLKSLNQLAINETKIYKENYQEANRQVRVEKFKSDLKGIGGFLLGVLATSAAAYAAIRIAK